MVNTHHEEVLKALASKGAESPTNDADKDANENGSSFGSKDLNFRGFTEEETKILESIRRIQQTSKEDTAYQRLDFIRKRAYSIPNTAYPTAYIRRDLEEPWSDNGVPYQLCDQICEPYRFKNGMTKWPTCSSDIDGFCNGGKLPGMVRVGCMTYFQDHKCSFENFHELDYDVLVKLEECWWKANAHEIATFTRWENYGQGPYANIKIEKTYDPYLDINRIFGRNYGANNVGDTQDCQEHKKEHEGNKHTKSSKLAHDPSKCQVRRFEMIKYSFDANDEYVARKEHECFDHSSTNTNACQAYRELFCIMDEGWLVTKANEKE
ncbi:hypothetical protein Tco_1043876 [Tanacetum coccineum]|uniref:Uncharacterized protein n=1 Tax=Tanacetum coccineum TaxID=301880 RepID=A0ABQ5GND1_9ASTR